MYSQSISLPNASHEEWLAVAKAVEAAGGCASEIRLAVHREQLLNNGSEKEILSYFQRMVDAPIVMNTVYGAKARWHLGREIHGTNLNDRRPVLMRGCKAAMISRYSLSNSLNPAGYCNEVFWRFVANRKLTILSEKDWEAIATPIIKELHRRYPRARLSTSKNAITDEYFSNNFRAGFRVLKGRRIFLVREALDTFDNLARIVTKFSKLEDRRSASRTHFKTKMRQATEARQAQLMKREGALA